MQQWHPDNTDAVSRAMSDTVTSEMFVVLGLRVSLDTFSWLDLCFKLLSRHIIAARISLLRIVSSTHDRWPVLCLESPSRES